MQEIEIVNEALDAEYAAFRDFWHIRPTMEAGLKGLAEEQEADTT